MHSRSTPAVDPSFDTASVTNRPTSGASSVRDDGYRHRDRARLVGLPAPPPVRPRWTLEHGVLVCEGHGHRLLESGAAKIVDMYAKAGSQCRVEEHTNGLRSQVYVVCNLNDFEYQRSSTDPPILRLWRSGRSRTAAACSFT